MASPEPVHIPNPKVSSLSVDTPPSPVNQAWHHMSNPLDLFLSALTPVHGTPTPAALCLSAETVSVSICIESTPLAILLTSLLTDHCVQAVGVYPATTNGYWKVRNSWGTSWGESGYIRLAYGSNTCDITNDPTYVSVGKY